MANSHPIVDEPELPDGAERPTFLVRPTRAARKEGRRLLGPEALVWTVDQLRLLEFWPSRSHEGFRADLDIGKV